MHCNAYAADLSIMSRPEIKIGVAGLAVMGQVRLSVDITRVRTYGRNWRVMRAENVHAELSEQ